MAKGRRTVRGDGGWETDWETGRPPSRSAMVQLSGAVTLQRVDPLLPRADVYLQQVRDTRIGAGEEARTARGRARGRFGTRR